MTTIQPFTFVVSVHVIETTVKRYQHTIRLHLKSIAGVSKMNDIVKLLGNILYFFYLWFEGIVLLLIPSRLRYKELKGETVLITGGGSGIGRLLGLKLARFGCRIIIWDVNEKGNEETKEMVEKEGGECFSYVCDVTKRETVYATAKKIKDEIGPVTILINNAGIVTGKLLLDCPDHMIEKTFQVNAISHFWTCKAFLPDMISMNHGHIVTVSSLAGFSGISGLSDYCASKSAANTFHETLLLELKKKNHPEIKTTLIAPFFINTGLFEGADGGYFPFLEPDYVADKIVSGIRCNQDIVILPMYFTFLLALKAMAPLTAFVHLFETLKGLDAMDRFVGKSQKTD